MPRLTDITIKNLKPDRVRREIPDKGCAGLYLIVQPSGHKSFAARFRFQGKPKKLSLGTLSLAAARKAATAALHDAKQGLDPTAAKRAAKVERRVVASNTFRAVTERYMTLVAGMRRDGHGKVTFTGNIRTAARQLQDLERTIFPTLGHRPVVEIKRSEIVALLDGIELESGPVAADRALAVIRRILNWYATRADNFVPPIVKGMARTSTKERAKSRILNDKEICAIWNTKQSGPFPALVRFLLLTGARRNEAAAMTQAEIEGEVWRLPAARNKTKTELVRPLSAAALAVLESQKREGCRFVFGNVSGRAPTNTFGRDKTTFDAMTGTTDWTLHDLRRTARSLMSRAGINADVGERCLGHALPGIRGTYDRHDYQREMKRAYGALAALIERIANPPKGNVTQLRKNRRR